MSKFYPRLKKMATLIQCKAALHVYGILLFSPIFAFCDNVAFKSNNVKINREFVVIVCSYKNQKYVNKNLASIFNQSYDSFRVIYLDDKSPDHTFAIAKYMTKHKKHSCHVTLISNSNNVGCMENTYNAINMCRDDEIIVILDGDDWFAHDHVLANLNRYYQDENVWLTYGQYKEWPSGKIGFNRACKASELNGNMRKAPWVTTHLRTFYAGLFKKIKKTDLMRWGQFVDVTSDQAFMLPMLDMARQHSFFIPEVMYIYNKANPSSDRKYADRQLEMKAYIRTLPTYQPLTSHPRG
ncbi:MAG: glycosyltransferase family A protein [Rhabdochlamydiaceae bacterium]|nr:glycosyltransferase family A protein [Candidatus Amphrikana amoebophyrae]